MYLRAELSLWVASFTLKNRWLVLSQKKSGGKKNKSLSLWHQTQLKVDFNKVISKILNLKHTVSSQRPSMLLIGHQVILCLKWCFAETQGIDGFLDSSLALFPGTSLERGREGDINQCASVLSSCLLLSYVNDVPPQWSGVRLQDNSSTPGKMDTDLISSSRDFIKKVKLVKYLTFVNIHRGDLQKEFDIELVINT